MQDLFGNEVEREQITHVNVYADEIQKVKSPVSGEEWIYTGAIYETAGRPIVNDLVFRRYRKDLSGWRTCISRNDSEIHWRDMKDDSNKRHILKRWLAFLLEDCAIGERKFRFSILGINLSNLNIDEFGQTQVFNNVYNRFFRSILMYSLKKFFGPGVVVDHIFHEEGQQQAHVYFDWHTIFKLNQDEHINLSCDRIEFLPKSHKFDDRSNVLQLCDALLGIFKDVHLGFNADTYSCSKRDILSSNFVKELLIKRVVRAPQNNKSQYGYANRFNISLFPRRKTEHGSKMRKINNYYDTATISLGSECNPSQMKLL